VKFQSIECSFYRIASSNNTSKSESDQEDNDDINDNDWSYGSEKKGELTQFVFLFSLTSHTMFCLQMCPVVLFYLMKP